MPLARMQRWGTPGCECRTCPGACSAETFACSEWCCAQTPSPWTRNLRERNQTSPQFRKASTLLVLVPKRERVFQIPGIIMKDPWGSMATKQALRMLGESAAEIPHILHMSFSLLLRDCRFRRLSKQLQSEEGNLFSEVLSQKNRDGHT